MTVALGIASRRIMGAIGCSSSIRVRESISADRAGRCRFASLCRQLSMAGATILLDNSALVRGSRPHFSARENASVWHDNTAEDCMTGTPSRSPFNYS